jgi:ATP synthase in type III secretion protein N
LSSDLDKLRDRLGQTTATHAFGSVVAVTGLSCRVRMGGVRVGDLVFIRRPGEKLPCEIVGFDGGLAVAMPLGALRGVGLDDEVESASEGFKVPVSAGLLGRVVDGLGRPIDGLGDLPRGEQVPVDRDPVAPLARRPVRDAVETGVRVLDGLNTLGRGQRVGLFAGSGVGKSTLLGAVARGTEADVVVVALVGERGREVGEFLEGALGEEGRKKSVVVVATSDASPLERLRAAQVATAYAEHFRDKGKHVLLLVDSVTRFARAQREIGLACGEPPARRGYPPSVFAMLPRLLERAGQGESGAITAIYTVLVEGGDMDEPIADEVRGILDGHVVLDRAIAARGIYPAVDPLVSLSRVMDAVVSPEHAIAARRLRTLLAAYESKRDLIALGAYTRGADKRVDEAITLLPRIEAFLRQNPSERTKLAETIASLVGIVS